jgi:hypothetical protein
MRIASIILALSLLLPRPLLGTSKRAACRTACQARIAECIGACGVYGPVEKTCQKLVLKACVRDGVASCGGTTTTTPGGGGTTTTTLAPFGATCTGNGDCQSNLCHAFSMGGMRCTQPCTLPTDCPDPQLGCSAIDVCKVP